MYNMPLIKRTESGDMKAPAYPPATKVTRVTVPIPVDEVELIMFVNSLIHDLPITYLCIDANSGTIDYIYLPDSDVVSWYFGRK